jgi:DNA-binding NtrC family response regulator
MPLRILLIDDDPNIQETAKDILEDAGYLVDAAGTGQEALKKLKDHAADVAVMDFNLPDTLGVDLAIQAKRQCPGLHVILMTGEAHIDLGPAKDIIQATLTKPVNPSDLIALIRRIS